MSKTISPYDRISPVVVVVIGVKKQPVITLYTNRYTHSFRVVHWSRYDFMATL